MVLSVTSKGPVESAHSRGLARAFAACMRNNAQHAEVEEDRGQIYLGKCVSILTMTDTFSDQIQV